MIVASGEIEQKTIQETEDYTNCHGSWRRTRVSPSFWRDFSAKSPRGVTNSVRYWLK